MYIELEMGNSKGISPVGEDLTALALSMTRGDLSNLQTFLAAGGNPDQRNRAGVPMLASAAKANAMDRVRVLIAAGAKIDFPRPDGKTALHIACEQGFVDLVQILLGAGADVNARDLRLNRPLHLASKKGAVEVIDILLAHPNIEVNKKNIENKTALDFANRYPEIASKLLNAGVEQHSAYFDLRSSSSYTAKQTVASNDDGSGLQRNKKVSADAVTELVDEFKKIG